MIWSEWLNWLIRFPCPLCQRATGSGQDCFCHDCQDHLQQLRYHPWCSFESSPETGTNLPIYAWGVYQGTLRRALQRLKYDGQARIGLTLGRWLGQCWQRATDRQTRYAIVPIPLHRERLQQRGYNQAELISRGFCDVTGLEHLPHSLRRSRQTQPQYGLTAAGRQHNLQGAFEAIAPLKSPVLLIDDIYTTGATIRAAAQALRREGEHVAGAVVVARAPLTPNPAPVSYTSRIL